MGQEIERAITALASAARTASVSSGPIRPPAGARAAYILLDVTAITASPSLTLSVRVMDANGDWHKIFEAGAAVTATGNYLYLMGQGAAAAAHDIDEIEDRHLPKNLDIYVTHGDADSATYSVRVVWA